MRKALSYIIISLCTILTLNQCDNLNPEITEEEQPIPVELVAPLNKASDQSLSIELKWQKIRGAKEYIVALAADASFNSMVTDSTIEGTSMQSPELEPNEEYFWRVYPLKGNAPVEWSETWSFTTGNEDTPVVTAVLISPENDAVFDAPDVNFEWQDINSADSYNFQLGPDTSFTDILIDTVISSASVNISDLEYASEYGWKVTPILASGTGAASETRIFTVNAEPEVASVSVSLDEPGNSSTSVTTDPVFRWTGSGEISDYTLTVSLQSDLSDPVINETVQTESFEATGLDYGSDYYWQVTVTGTQGQTATSDSWSFGTEPEPYTPPVNTTDFVQVQNGDFVLNGETFRFSGTNAYYLPNYEKINSGVVDRALNLFENTGVNVVRMWAFYDGYDCGYSKNDPSENVIQTEPGVYSEEALRDLDNVIAKGKERGIRFILPFINYWDELGGVCQYNTWAGASDPSTNMEFFLNNDQTQQWYRDYIDMLLNRVNTVTGVAYKDEPAIMAWQIINEGRNRGKDAAILRDWYQEIAQYIKSIDSNHLLSTGEEGFDEGTPSEYTSEDYSNTYTLRANEGTSYVMNTAIPEIDFGNAHWYPTEYGFGSTLDNDFFLGQRAWLNDHQQIAENNGKPFIIGEYGYPGWGDERVDQMYTAFYDHAETIGLDGNLLWQLVADGTKCWEFGGNICFPDGRADNALYNDFKTHVGDIKRTQ